MELDRSTDPVNYRCVGDSGLPGTSKWNHERIVVVVFFDGSHSPISKRLYVHDAPCVTHDGKSLPV